MNRTFATLLTVFWTITFAASAWAAALADGVLMPVGASAAEGALQLSHLLGQLGVVLGNALVAVLFLWTFVVSVLEKGETRETATVAQLACAGALLMLIVDAVQAGFVADATALTPTGGVTVKFLAILATHLVLRRQELADNGAEQQLQPAPVTRFSAMRLVDAAHETMTARLASRLVARRGFQFSPPANDDRSH